MLSCCGQQGKRQLQVRKGYLAVSLRAESGMFFAGLSEAIPHLQEIASSQTTLLAMTSAEVPFRVQHEIALP